MANFNTNQARHFYVAKTYQDSVGDVAAAGDITMISTATGEFAFVLQNADGIITRTDTVHKDRIQYANIKAVAGNPLLAHTIALDTTNYALANLVGETLTVNIAVREFISYDPADMVNVTAAVKVTSAMSTAALFHKALAIAIAKAMPKRQYPYFRIFSNGTEVTASTADADVTGSANGVVLVATEQKYVRGKMSATPFSLTVSFNVDGEAWGTVTVAPSEISGYTVTNPMYELADLEYFCYGERGDTYRGSIWPNEYNPTYSVDVAADPSDFALLNIQYYWQGNVENIQKSPRTLQILAPTAEMEKIASALTALIDAELINPNDLAASFSTSGKA